MEDAARDLGLAYANSLPLVLASVLVPLIAIAWLAIKAKDLDESIRNFAFVCLGVAALFFVVQAPGAYSKAKSQCRAEWRQDAGTSPGFATSVPVSYRLSKCYNAWPYGPD